VNPVSFSHARVTPLVTVKSSLSVGRCAFAFAKSRDLCNTHTHTDTADQLYYLDYKVVDKMSAYNRVLFRPSPVLFTCRTEG